jgi:hypothetical protein
MYACVTWFDGSELRRLIIINEIIKKNKQRFLYNTRTYFILTFGYYLGKKNF